MNIKSFPQHLNFLFDDPQTFPIHSVYQNTINFRRQSRIYSLHHRQLLQTPMSIILDMAADQFQELAKKATSITVHKDGIQIGSTWFDRSQSRQVPLDMNQLTSLAPSSKQLTFLANQIYSTISQSKRSDLKDALLKNTVKETTKIHLYQKLINKLVSVRRREEVAQTITQFIGLGDGLTPAGDDLIVGILAALHFQKNNDSAQQLMALIASTVEAKVQIPNATNDISLEFLTYALKGYFSESVMRLYEQLSFDQPLASLIEEISNYGHSSGIDFLSGMLIGIMLGGISYDL